ncbi:M-phase phosphoprotein 8 isoform 2-T2 [Rhinophrynus dorsalis]
MAEVVGHDGSPSMAAGGKVGGEAVTGGAADGELGDGAVKTDAAESEQDDEEDVFEVESILDSKIEGGEVLYRVRWKGYDSDGDTWEPEAHLDDCKEVLLEFRRKLNESKQKAVKKEISKLSLNDVFDAESDSEPQFDGIDASPQKKKKKSKEEDDERYQEEMKKKKSKSGKSKEKSKLDSESSENLSPESKPKKRTSDGKEDLNNKKQRKDEFKESKKSRKEDLKEKAEYKERKHKKEKLSELEQSSHDSQISPQPVTESADVSMDLLTEDRKPSMEDQDNRDQEVVHDMPDQQLSEVQAMEDDADEVKMKKKKKKHKKLKTERGEESKRSPSEELQVEKKSSQKKQKHVEKVKDLPTLEKLPSLPAPIQKSSRASMDDKARWSVDSVSEEKEAKKTDLAKEKPRKKHDSEKEGKKEQKVIKTSKELKSAFDAFTVTHDDRTEYTEISRKKEEVSLDYKHTEEYKTKEIKPMYKERRSTREETEPWSSTVSEGDQEVMDTMCHMQDNTGLDSKAQVGLGMDLQLEWMTLEDFQKHLEGTDEILPTGTVSSSALKDAVKNGDYLTVKFALNSTEEYNLDQEDSSGMTLVMLAAAAGQDDLLRLLIKKGAKINARQKNGTTALIHAAEKNHLTTVALLLEAGAYVNMQQATGETALMKACKRGNSDIVRLLIEHGADCNVLSKHQGSALQFAKQSNNVLLFELLKSHLEMLSRVVEDAIRDYFETRLVLLEPIFPIACHRLCEGPDFSLDFNYKPPFNIPEGSGILLFVFHANFFGKEVVVRLCGPCSVQAVVLNDKFQLPVFLDAHFIYSFSPVAGPNKLFIRLSEVPTAKVKLLICAYRVQLQ